MCIRDRLNRIREESQQGGGEKRTLDQHKKGKLTAKERLEILLDDSSFIEIDAFVRHGSHDFDLEKQRPYGCLLYTSPSPRDRTRSRMPSSA